MTVLVILSLLAFGFLVAMVEVSRARWRPALKALKKTMERAELVELEAWAPDPGMAFDGRGQRREIMRRLATTTAILLGLVLWHVFVVPPVRGDDTIAPVAMEEAESVQGLVDLLYGDAEAGEMDRADLPGKCWTISGGAEVPAACPSGVSVGTLIGAVDEAPMLTVVPGSYPQPAVEPEPDDAVDEDQPIQQIVVISGGKQPEPEAVDGEDGAAIPDPDSDADATEILGAVNHLVQAIKDKNAVAITVGVFLILFGVFRLRAVRDGLGKWIPEKWYRVIPIVLAVVLGILVAILAGGKPLDAVLQGLAGGGGIAVVYGAIVVAAKKKAAGDA